MSNETRQASTAAMKRCSCGYLPLPDATHCPKCGKPIESAAQGQRDPYEGAPLILYRCPNCDRVFDSPSVCVEDSSQAVAYVRPIKLALVKKLPLGQPMGVGILGIPGIWADAYIAVDFETGAAEVYPVEVGYSGTAGPSHTEGLDLRVKVERKP